MKITFQLLQGAALLTAALATTPFARAQTTVQIPASANAFVLRSSGTTVQNASQTLTTKQLNDGNARIAYLRFDLGFFLAAHSTNDIQSVKLRLLLVSLGGAASSVRAFGLNDYVTNSALWPGGLSDAAWSQATMVFTNQPAGTNNAGQIPNSATALPNPNTTALLGSAAYSTATSEVGVTLDPTAFINLLAADTNQKITLMIHNLGNNTPTWASISNTAGNLVPTLEIVAASGSGGLVWSGYTNANWDTSTKNWLDTNNAPVSFTSGNSAIFDDSSSVTGVSLVGNIFPQTVTLSNNVNTYTLGGSGKIGGAASIVLAGSGTTILNEIGGNDFSGGVTINSGTLQVGNGGAGGAVASGGITDNGALVFDRTGSLTVSGAISGTGTLTKNGAGTVILTGGNIFSGGTTINNGVLQIGDGGVSGSLGTGDVTDDGTLAFNRGNNLTVALNISGTGGVAQNGSGTLTLTGSDSYSGPTVVNNGTLLVNTTLSSTSIASNDVAGTLGGSGTISAPVNTRGRINPGPANAANTLTVGTTTLHSGATVRFDLSSDANTVGSGMNDLLSVTGDLNLNNNVIQANFLGLPQSGSSYHVLDYAGTKTGSFNATATGTHYTVTVDESVTNQILLAVSGAGASLTWNSTTSSNWDVGSSSNWLNGGATDVFYGGDRVLFDDSVANSITNIMLSGVLSPASITNNSSRNYALTGDGIISGSTGFTKKGSGKLSLDNAGHNFTGSFVIGGGMVSVPGIAGNGNASAIGRGPTMLDGGTLQVTAAGGLAVAHDLTLTTNGGGIDFSSSGSGPGLILSITGNILLPDNGPRTLTLGGNDPVPLQLPQGSPLNQALGDSPDAQPTTLVKIGNCAWRFPTANSYSGGTFVNAGKVTLLNASGFGSGIVTVASGAEASITVSAAIASNFSIAGPGVSQQPAGESVDQQGAIHFVSNGSSISGNVTLTGDARITARGATAPGGTIDGQVTGNFNLEFGHPGGTGAGGSGNGVVTLANSANDWSGNTIISHGIVKVGGAGEVIPNGGGKGNVILNGSGALSLGNVPSVLDLNGVGETVNGLSSSNNASLCVVTNTSTTAATLTVGDNNASSTYGGLIRDGVLDGMGAVGLTKIGNGTLTLTNANAYTGDTLVGGSTLIVSGSIGNTTVSNNATLGGSATVNNNLTVNANGTLSPGGNGAIGTLTVVATATLAGTNRLEVNAANGTSDQVIAGILDYTGGHLIVSNLGGTLTNGVTFQLFSAPGYPATPFASIALPALNAGLGWQTNLTVDGTIKVVSVAFPVSPKISSVSVSGGSVVLSGTNNAGAGGTYQILTSTNVALPLTNWTVLTNGTFDVNGNFSSTNVTSGSQRFYILQVP